MDQISTGLKKISLDIKVISLRSFKLQLQNLDMIGSQYDGCKSS